MAAGKVAHTPSAVLVVPGMWLLSTVVKRKKNQQHSLPGSAKASYLKQLLHLVVTNVCRNIKYSCLFAFQVEV